MPPPKVKYPVSGPITQGVGPGVGGLDSPGVYKGQYYPSLNKGLDFGVDIGTPVASPVNGTVIASGFQDPNNANVGWGLRVWVRDQNGVIHNFGHLGRADVKVGDSVRAGQIIALSGDTGASTGPHLSYDVFRDNGSGGMGEILDPDEYLTNYSGGGGEAMNQQQGQSQGQDWSFRVKQEAARMFPGNLRAQQYFYNMIRQESGNFNPDVIYGRVTSSAGARGIAQFMPQTAAGMKIDPDDPEQALPAAAQFFRQLISNFGGDLNLAAAAYNWGPGNVAKAVQTYGGNWATYAPAETQYYLQIVSQPTDITPGATGTAATATNVRGGGIAGTGTGTGTGATPPGYKPVNPPVNTLSADATIDILRQRLAQLLSAPEGELDPTAVRMIQQSINDIEAGKAALTVSPDIQAQVTGANNRTALEAQAAMDRTLAQIQGQYGITAAEQQGAERRTLLEIASRERVASMENATNILRITGDQNQAQAALAESARQFNQTYGLDVQRFGLESQIAQGQLALGQGRLNLDQQIAANQNAIAQEQLGLDRQRMDLDRQIAGTQDVVNTISAMVDLLTAQIAAGELTERAADRAVKAVLDVYDRQPFEGDYMPGYEPGGMYSQIMGQFFGVNPDMSQYKLRKLPFDPSVLERAQNMTLTPGFEWDKGWEKAQQMIQQQRSQLGVGLPTGLGPASTAAPIPGGAVAAPQVAQTPGGQAPGMQAPTFKGGGQNPPLVPAAAGQPGQPGQPGQANQQATGLPGPATMAQTGMGNPIRQPITKCPQGYEPRWSSTTNDFECVLIESGG